MIVDFKNMLQLAKENKYAVAQFNINNLEWSKYILEECNSEKVPVILGVSEGAAKYMGGFFVVSSMVKAMIKDLCVEIPVCLHLDHGSKEACFKAIDSGFSSVMIDASKEELDNNIKITKEVVDYAHLNGVSVEAEIGHIGGEEDGVSNRLLYARVDECLKLVEETGVDSLAPALGSVHGLYKGEPDLDFDTMKQINDNLQIPLVLHGGTGIPEEQIKKAINCGISKININTDLQIVWSDSVKNYIKENSDVYDPRKIIGSGESAIKGKIKNIISLFGTTKME